MCTCHTCIYTIHTPLNTLHTPYIHAIYTTTCKVRRSRFLDLGFGAFGIFGYGAGTKDVSGNNTFEGNYIAYVGLAKPDAPAIVLWHTAFNNITGNYVHDTPSKVRSIVTET